jgi:hypothetical protein
MIPALLIILHLVIIALGVYEINGTFKEERR